MTRSSSTSEALWRSWLARRPVTAEVAGSSPVRVAVEAHDLGLVLGGSGMLRILPDQVRIPDVSFISWDRLPGGKLPPERVARLAPTPVT